MHDCKLLPQLKHWLIPVLAVVVCPENISLCAVGLGRLPPGFRLEIFISEHVWLVLLPWFNPFSELYYAVSSAPRAACGCNLPKTPSILSLQMLFIEIKAVFHGENQQCYGESSRSMRSVGIT